MNIFKRIFIKLFGWIGEPSPKMFERMKIAASTIEDEEWISKLRQESEDREFERDVRAMAHDMLFQYLNLKQNKNKALGEVWTSYEGIIIPKPVRFIYTIFHESSAKYMNANIGKMAFDLFNQLKEPYDKRSAALC